jgi:hypothetical protein
MVLCAPVLAQDPGSANEQLKHPILTSTFEIGIGGFWPTKDITLSVNGSVPEEDIDFENDLGYSESDSSAVMIFRWRFGEKWSFWTQAWKLDSTAGAVLEEDIEWEDYVFQEGSFVNSGVELSVVRLFFGRTFHTGPKHEFGLGLGVHWLEFGAFIEGEIRSNDEAAVFARGDIKSDFPMPNIGGWYYYALSPEWALQARVDWLHVSLDRYSGGMWNMQAGVQWNPSRHLGVGLSFNNFGLDGSVDDTDWRGKLEYNAYGPLLNVNYSW